MQEDGFNCPNCGAGIPRRLRGSKMLVCEYCESTVILDDDGLREAGKRGIMAEEPSLLQVGRPFDYRGASYLPVGQARFAYSSGWWDEFWVMSGAGEGVWISVDEGDIAIERPWDIFVALNPEALRVGDSVELQRERFRITEADESECIGLKGEFPEELHIGQRYRYWLLSGPRGRLVSLEFSHGEFSAHEGSWIDPYEIRAQALA